MIFQLSPDDLFANKEAIMETIVNAQEKQRAEGALSDIISERSLQLVSTSLFREPIIKDG